MKTLVSLALASVLLGLIIFSCKKETNQDAITSSLDQSKKLLQNSFQIVKFNDDLLKLGVSFDGTFTDPNVIAEDKLYHLNDSLCNIYYLTFCKAMLDADNSMGANMMNGNSTHGSTMMSIHTHLADTSLINQFNRDLISIRQAHANHHPTATLSEHESHHP